MNTIELMKNIESDFLTKKHFKGVFSRDLLPSKITYPSSFIANNQNSNRPGQHWIAFYINGDRKLYFFDSMGLHPSFYGLDDYIKSISNSFEFNKKQYQDFFSSYCGHYCLLFLFLRNRNKTFNSKLFTKDYKKNDKIIKKLIREKFFI